MQTVKSYRAYYDGVMFVPYEALTIPRGSQAIVTILDFAAETGDVNNRQFEAMCRFREEIRDDGDFVPEFERIKLREVEI